MKRTATIKRQTKETDVRVELNLDGSGQWNITTGIRMFDHLLSQMARHGRFDLKVSATGDNAHHLVEDVALCLGKALGQALGEKRGIVRMADASVPMDDALAMVAVDISGRGYAVLDLPFSGNDVAELPADLVRHFLETFAVEAKLNLHAKIVYGTNDHHKVEALYKALGRAMDIATRMDERIGTELPSTKELLESLSTGQPFVSLDLSGCGSFNNVRGEHRGGGFFVPA
ncbi:MAG: imidazoleglycerol-phosphate dehydratase HisB [Dehalococcoidales bacterium]|nr:imidazoleglycerol-phosphate dehydratase HisB [Dehalococcoidales bacterium]